MSPRTRLTRWLLFALLCTPAGAAAEAEAPALEPARYVGTWSVGAPLRLTQRDEFGQDALAPIFTDALFGYVFPSASQFRHGVGLGASLNLSGDGGYAEPIYSAEQLVVMPAYLLYADLGGDWFGLGHLGVPVLVTSDPTAGGEIGAGLGYRLLAGLGVFGELAANAFVGTSGTLNPTLSLELGLFLDFEVLP
jgi:hypothetical protein